MSEENPQIENMPPPPAPHANPVAKVEETVGKVGSILERGVDKALGLVGDHPWEKWLAVANKYIAIFLPALVAVLGVVAFLLGMVWLIKEKAPCSELLVPLFALVGVVFSMLLAPKALALTNSFIEKGEPESIRPELLHILKVVLGLGGLAFALYLLLQFDADKLGTAVVAIAVSLLSVVLCSRPGLIGVKADYPKNGVEEAITLLFLPVKIMLAFLPFIVVGCTIVTALQCFGEEYGIMAAGDLFAAAVMPLAVPLAVYFCVLAIYLVLDVYRAIVSVPRKLDALRQALEEKNK